MTLPFRYRVGIQKRTGSNGTLITCPKPPLPPVFSLPHSTGHSCPPRFLESPFLHLPLYPHHVFSSVQLLSCVRLFATPWTAVCQASLSITNSWSLPKLMSTESVMPSNHLILYHPLPLPPSIFPSIRVFQMSQLFASGGQSVSASISVLPMNTQDWSLLGWTCVLSVNSSSEHEKIWATLPSNRVHPLLSIIPMTVFAQVNII